MDDINLYNDGKHPDNVFYKSERHTAPQKFRPKSAIVPCGDELQKRTIYGEHPLNKLDILYGECGTFDGAKRHGGEEEQCGGEGLGGIIVAGTSLQSWGP